jgi:hypothetical protein
MSRRIVLVASAWICAGASGDHEAELALSHLRDARIVRIEEGWMGLSPIAPTVAVYTFVREANRVRGWARLLVAAGPGQRGSTVTGLSVPPDVFEAFLSRLSTADLSPGSYEPTITHTDDYPSLTIEVAGDRDVAIFHSQSQGEGHVPWRFEFGDRQFVVDSDVPRRALDILGPYLPGDVFEAMKREGPRHLSDEQARRDEYWKRMEKRNDDELRELIAGLFDRYRIALETRNMKVTEQMRTMTEKERSKIQSLLEHCDLLSLERKRVGVDRSKVWVDFVQTVDGNGPLCDRSSSGQGLAAIFEREEDTQGPWRIVSVMPWGSDAESRYGRESR